MPYNSALQTPGSVCPAPDGFGLWRLDRGLAVVGCEKRVFGVPSPATSEPLSRVNHWPSSSTRMLSRRPPSNEDGPGPA